MSRRILIGVAVAVLGLGGVVTARAARLEPYRVEAGAPDPGLAAAAVSTDRFAGALRFPTISSDDTAGFDPKPFLELHEYLRAAFPAVHARLTREVVGGLSLLYTWPGSDPSLAPLLLMGHLDVVPVEPGTESRWTHPPFSGAVADGFVWGRGAIDSKITVVGILEAVDLLLRQGFRPRRTVYLAFGHDEERGGFEGAARMAKLIEERSGQVAFLVDEGGLVGEGMIPGVTRPVALVGVVEKAALNVELTVEAPGGHSSMPPRHTAVGRLSRAIVRLEDRPMPLRLTPVNEAMFARIAPDLPFVQRVLLGNLWLFRPLVVRAMAGNERVAATLRTTTAVTMISGSPKSNVLPIRARAVVNFRILPGDTPDDVLAHVRRAVGDTAVRVAALGRRLLPSPVADWQAPEFALLERTIGQWFPGAVPVPFLLIGGTNTRHYERLTRNVYRFVPVVATPELVGGAHGTNERVRAADFARAVRFYAQLIRNAS